LKQFKNKIRVERGKGEKNPNRNIKLKRDCEAKGDNVKKWLISTVPESRDAKKEEFTEALNIYETNK
jgi:hypothetical protein